MSKIGARQDAIIRAFRDDESFTKQQAVGVIGPCYYCNERKHVGDVLSRMVESRIITRISRGRFVVGYKPERQMTAPTPKGECQWCGDNGCLVCANMTR